MQKNSSPISPAVDANKPRDLFVEFLPAHVQRKIARRWEAWAPWVLVDLRRNCDSDRLAAEFERIRRQHSDQLLRLMQAGIEMRVIRRHNLDDPRLTDEARAARMGAAIERRRHAIRKPLSST